MDLRQADDGEGLDAAIGHGEAEEEQQVAQDRRAQQQVEPDLWLALLAGSLPGLVHDARQDAAGHDQQQRGANDRTGGEQEGAAPAPQRRAAPSTRAGVTPEPR